MFSSQSSTPEFKPSSGRITYNRWMGHNFEVKGRVVGERQVTVRRYNAVVTEYLVKPDDGFTNLSKHVVNEGDVVNLERCPDCGDTGYISVRNGDDDQPCSRCNPLDVEGVF